MERHSHCEVGAATGAVAMSMYGAAVQFDKRLHHCQSNAQTAAGNVAVAIVGLTEKVKDVRKQIRANPAAAIPDLENSRIVFAAELKPNRTAFRCVLPGIVKQIEKDLLKAKRVRVEPQRRIASRY